MHKMAFAHVFGPEKKNGFGPFSYKFFVCIRVGLNNNKSVLTFFLLCGQLRRSRCVQIFCKHSPSSACEYCTTTACSSLSERLRENNHQVGENLSEQSIQVIIASRALSLRNLVSGYECGRVFPAGVGPGSPSRDAANWLPSRSDLSVETRRQYGWLRMVFSGVRLFRAPIWWPSGGWRHARGREHCRGEPGGSLSGGYAPDSAKAEGSSIVDEPGEG